MKIKIRSGKTIAAFGFAVIAIGAYWHYSPYLAMRSMRVAAETQDAVAFNEKVDYPRIREGLKSQMAAKFAHLAGGESRSGNQTAARGSALGLALMNPIIDLMVRPEMVMKAFSKGESGVKPSDTEANRSAETKQRPRWEIERVGVNKVVAYAQHLKEPGGAKFGFVFERHGFADWKLTELLLPMPLPE